MFGKYSFAGLRKGLTYKKMALEGSTHKDFLEMMDQSDSGESIELDEYPPESIFRKCWVILYTGFGFFKGVYIYFFTLPGTWKKEIADLTPQPDF
jgi:hypothetical protein